MIHSSTSDSLMQYSENNLVDRLTGEIFDVPVNKIFGSDQEGAEGTLEGGYPSPEGGFSSRGVPRGLSTSHITRKVLGNIDYFIDGSLIKVTKPRISQSQKGGGYRGRISGFSKNSRRRLMRTLAKVSKVELPLFVTLTYPAQWDPDYKTWKRDLEKFIKRLNYKFEKSSGFWKLEPQKRGAPHFHMMIWGVKFLDLMCFTAKAWYEVVKSGDYNHFLAGTRVERVKSWKGVMSYSAKYLGKVVESLEGWDYVGRYWGMFSKVNLPWSELVSVELTEREAINFIRLLRRYAHIKGRDYKSLTCFVNNPAYWFEKSALIC